MHILRFFTISLVTGKHYHIMGKSLTPGTHQRNTVIRPQKPVTVDRIERDIRKLTDLYEEGYACAAKYEFQ